MTCSVPGCQREVRYVAAQLCGAHYTRQRRGQPLDAIRAGPGRPAGEPSRLVATRISIATLERLEAWARTSRYRSTYDCLRDVVTTTLEHWGTPELQEKLAELEQRASVGPRAVQVRRGRARKLLSRGAP